MISPERLPSPGKDVAMLRHREVRLEGERENNTHSVVWVRRSPESKGLLRYSRNQMIQAFENTAG